MIRKIQKNDIKQVVHIWLEASVAAHPFIPSSFWEDRKADMENIYLPSAENYVYEEEGAVIAFISLIGEYIAALFVNPSCQGKGIGFRLLSFAKDINNHLVLKVYIENEKAVSFYRKNDFLVTGKQTDENTGHEEIIMEFSHCQISSCGRINPSCENTHVPDLEVQQS